MRNIRDEVMTWEEGFVLKKRILNLDILLLDSAKKEVVKNLNYYYGKNNIKDQAEILANGDIKISKDIEINIDFSNKIVNMKVKDEKVLATVRIVGGTIAVMYYDGEKYSTENSFIVYDMTKDIWKEIIGKIVEEI